MNLELSFALQRALTWACALIVGLKPFLALGRWVCVKPDCYRLNFTISFCCFPLLTPVLSG
jgi:hypothetical protein